MFTRLQSLFLILAWNDWNNGATIGRRSRLEFRLQAVCSRRETDRLKAELQTISEQIQDAETR
jgi:hypothetical protein